MRSSLAYFALVALLLVGAGATQESSKLRARPALQRLLAVSTSLSKQDSDSSEPSPIKLKWPFALDEVNNYNHEVDETAPFNVKNMETNLELVGLYDPPPLPPGVDVQTLLKIGNADRCKQSDIIFVVDGFTGLSNDGFAPVRLFLNAFTVAFQKKNLIQPAAVRLGIATFNEMFQALIDNPIPVEEAIGRMQPNQFGDSLDKGLVVARTELDSKQRSVPREYIVITDGAATTHPEDIQREAKFIREASQTSELYAIGIGADMDPNDLRAMVTDPMSTHVYLIDSLDKLLPLLPTFIGKFCT